MQSPPSEKGMISVPEGASFQGLGVETLFPAANQRSEGQAERPPLQNQTWMKCVCVSVTVFVDFAHC